MVSLLLIKNKNNRNIIDNVKSIDRVEFLEQIYRTIEDLLVNLFKNPNNINIVTKLNNVNKKILERNNLNNNVIVVREIYKLFTIQNILYKKLYQDLLNKMCEQQLNELAKKFAILVNNKDYLKQ